MGDKAGGGAPPRAWQPGPATEGEERPTDAAAPALWTPDEAKAFFEGFQRHNTDWARVAQAVPRKGPEACEALYKSFKSYLSLPKDLLNVTAFLAVVKDSLKMEESEADTVSEDKPGPDPEPELSRDEGTSKPVTGRRSQRVVEARQVSPVWGGRRARNSAPAAADDFVYLSPTGRGRRGGRSQAQADAMDAEGIDALLSLAAVAQEAQEASNEAENDDKPGGRPVRAHRRPRRHADEGDDAAAPERSPRPARNSAGAMASPPGRPRTQGARQLRSPMQDPLPPRTPSSRTKRDKAAKPAAPWRGDGDFEAGQEGAEEPEEVAASAGPKPRARRRRRGKASEDEDFELKPSKRNRRAESGDARSQPPQLGEADLEAEDEALEEEQAAQQQQQHVQQQQQQDVDWSKLPQTPMPRKRSRKALPERAPPMMASARALFSRRSSIAFATPSPAFMLGVPPASARAHAVETEGQSSMGPAELRLRRCLDPRVRRWCAYEFFCSALDRPWLMRNELRDYLRHVGIPAGVRLARPELALVRASLGRPRRLSLGFLRQERVKLEAWRERVRAQYSNTDPSAELPASMPSQLQVGQRVTARHPVTRQLHDGDVLTVGPNAYRVQFDRRELGVELVSDVEVMPVEPRDCLPAAVRAHLAPQALINGRSLVKAPARLAPAAEAPPAWPAFQAASHEPAGMAGRDAQGFANLPVTIRTLPDLKAALDKKERLLAQLKQMNDEVEAGLHQEVDGQRPEAFQKTYAQVLVDLQMMNRLLDTANLPKHVAAAVPLPQPQPPAAEPLPAPVQLPSVAAQPAEAAAPQRATPAVPAQVTWEGVWAAGGRLLEEAKAARQDAGGRGAVDRKLAPVADLVANCLCFAVGMRQCSADTPLFASLDVITGRALQALKPQARVPEAVKRNEAWFTSINDEMVLIKGHRHH